MDYDFLFATNTLLTGATLILVIGLLYFLKDRIPKAFDMGVSNFLTVVGTVSLIALIAVVWLAGNQLYNDKVGPDATLYRYKTAIEENIDNGFRERYYELDSEEKASLDNQMANMDIVRGKLGVQYGYGAKDVESHPIDLYFATMSGQKFLPFFAPVLGVLIVSGLISLLEYCLSRLHAGEEKRQEIIAGLNAEISNRKKESGDLKQSISSMDHELLEKKGQSQKLDKMIESQNSRLESIKSMAGDITKTEEYKTYIAIRKDIENLENEKSELEKRNDALQDEITGRTKKVEDLKKELGQLTAHLEQLKKEEKEHQDKIKEVAKGQKEVDQLLKDLD